MKRIYMKSDNKAIAPLMFGDHRVRTLRTIAARFSRYGEEFVEVEYPNGSVGIIGFKGSSWMEQPWSAIQPNHPAYSGLSRGWNDFT